MTKQQIVVLCGADMTGKTEISTALAEILKIPRFKATTEHQTFLSKQNMFVNQLRYADTRMVDFLEQTGHSVIFDRAWPCEWVYHQYFARESDIVALREVDLSFKEMGAKIVVCVRSSFEGIQDDLNPRLNSDELTKIQALYVGFSKWTKCPVHFLNVDDENLEREISDVLTFLGYSDEQKKSLIDDLREYEARRCSGVAACCV